MHTMTARSLGLNVLVGLSRARRVTEPPLVRLKVPDGMSTTLGTDAVGVPEELGRRVMARLPRMGCVYADGGRWWWIVPTGSDIALEWPAPALYAPGALVPDTHRHPHLLHRPDGVAPYTPPIPLYVALCRLTDTVPAWSRPVKTTRQDAG
ncbi:hypothetical protein [Streptomyces tsukubensis]|uniref:Uncharacterized protein n=1 Tax=Streptomyces tsukubensis TaxID=83656 RepID=A0A1V4A342_9ACTN|nr:hypothetical protein [Streptomyces tsukubensis]OON74690.1 hypothetical protein B1H18_24615 [Streptomyces tsukubensis]QFR93038.1 hypothetical protein GBW32_08065 [Streptomyces tsukubensis]